ncbi:MAG: hypothetical protein K6A92_07955, partial [Lachnospiraceae bacterium]|nr:hypothetical protein [Lachnospiraceae bacterium]
TCVYKNAAEAKAHPLALSLLFYDRIETDQNRICLYPYPEQTPSAGKGAKSSAAGKKKAPKQDDLLQGQILFEDPVSIAAEEREITDPRLMVAWKHPLTRVLIKPDACAKGETTVTLRFTLS